MSYIFISIDSNLFINDIKIPKSRAEFVYVEEIHSYYNNNNKNFKQACSFVSKHSNKKKFIYKKNYIVYPNYYEDNINIISGPGIYYCLNYKDAIQYHLR